MRPAKRNQRGIEDDSSIRGMPAVQSVEELISAKRQRTEFIDKSDQLEQMFAQLNESPFDDDFDEERAPSPTPRRKPDLKEKQDLLESDQSEAESDREEMSNHLAVADEVLDQYQSEKIKEILQNSLPETSQKEAYCFFRRKCRLPDPLWIEDNYPVLEKSIRERENFIYEMASTADGRKFLLYGGCIRTWFRRDWACPHTVYQWLFQIVAFETDQVVAKHAYETLTALWSNLGAEPAQYVRDEDLKGERNQNRHIDIDEFIYVLKNYGAVKSELAEDCEVMPRLSNSLLLVEDWSGQSGEQRIPLTQFMFVLRLFGYSVRNWPEAYRQVGIKYIIRLMFQISLDRVGSFMIRELQDAIESCLSILNESSWKDEVQGLANELCMRFNTVHLQRLLLQVTKPTYDRCIYLRRLIALTSLVRAIPPTDGPVSLSQSSTDSVPGEQLKLASAALMNTPNTSEYETASMELSEEESFLSFADSDTESINKERDMAMLDTAVDESDSSDSDSIMQQRSNTNAPNTPTSVVSERILQQTLDILINPKSIFQQRTHDDYDVLLCHIDLLDACIGSDEEELLQEQQTIKEIIKRLQVLNRRIGGRSTGTLKRMMASAAIQRLWNRLAYGTGRKPAGEIEHPAL